MVHMHNGIHSAMKNEIMALERKCMRQEIIMLNEIKQTQKDKISNVLSYTESIFTFLYIHRHTNVSIYTHMYVYCI